MTEPTKADLVRAFMRVRNASAEPLSASDVTVASLGDAYDLQYAHLAALAADNPAARIIGYKVGATNPASQNHLGLTGPFFAPILSTQASASPARLAASGFFHRIAEVELAFRLGEDLRPKPGSMHIPRPQLARAIASVMPAVEIADSRFGDWRAASGIAAIADLGYSGHWVHAAELTDWQGFDLPTLGARLWVDGERVRQGRGSDVLGDPLRAIELLALHLRARGQALRAGDVVTTGAMTTPFVVPGAVTLRAEIDAVGEVALQLT